MEFWEKAKLSLNDKELYLEKIKVEKLTEEVSELKTIVSELSYTVDELIKNK